MEFKNPVDVEVQTQDSESTKEQCSPNNDLVANWDSPMNLKNPRNWSTLKKTCHVIPVGLLCLSVTLGSSCITPGTFAIARTFGVSHTAALLPLSLFVLGLALGPMLAAPISETRGRAIVYKVSMPIYMLFIMGAGLSKTFSGLLVCRFFAAMFGAPCLAVGAGTVADLFESNNLATGGTFVVMAPFLGPCLGPVFGGLTATFTEYKWTQWTTIFVSLIAYLTVLPTQETHRKVLLNREAERLGLPLPEPKLPPREAIKKLFTIVLFRPIVMLFTEPIVAAYSVYNAFTFSVLFAFFEAYPIVFMREYRFNIEEYGLTFLGIGVGVIIGAIVAVLIDQLVYQRFVREGGRRITEKGPEQRLYVGMIGDIMLPVGLFWFAFTAKSTVHWIVPVMAGVPFAFGNVTVFISAALYMLDVYGQESGASAMAANGLLRYIMGAAFPLFTVQMYEKLGVQWATLLLAFVCLVMLPIPWLFYTWGSKVRARSPYSQ